MLALRPRYLVRGRIAAGLSQRAERLSMREQQIQCYETDDYQLASLATLLEITRALNIEIGRSAVFGWTARAAWSRQDA